MVRKPAIVRQPRQLYHRILVPAPRSEVYALLAHLERHVELHPFITAVAALDNAADTAATRHYQVTERMPLPGRRSYSYQLQAAVTRLDPERCIEFVAQCEPGIEVVTRFDLDGDGAFTRVMESVSIIAPPILIGFVARTARRAHLRLLDNLAQTGRWTHGNKTASHGL